MKIKVNLKKKYGRKGQGFDGGHASYYHYRDYYVMFEKDNQIIHEEMITMYIPQVWVNDPTYKSKWEIIDLINGDYIFDDYKISGSALKECLRDNSDNRWHDFQM